jgi:hypothetical protein
LLNINNLSVAFQKSYNQGNNKTLMSQSSFINAD